MKWLAQNWLWLVVVVLFVVMHLGHGGHGGHAGRRRPRRREEESRDVSSRAERPFGRTGHPH